jgi:CheY-like chemotaxis protein
LDRSGLGLGLSIVKILVEKHKGKIEAESAGVGKGAIFTVVFPLCRKQTDSPAEIEKTCLNEDQQLEGIKILVIEDDPDSREVLHLLLEQSGAEVNSTHSAQEAINLLRELNGNLPDVIISDLAMPNEDGYSLIERIRKLTAETGGEIPALALSAFASNDNKNKAYSAGFQKYHTKPFEPDVIIQDILEIVKR